MRCAVILYAPIGGGKTRTAESASEKLKSEGFKVMGILSKRVLSGDEYPCYDLLELDTGETKPLVKPAGKDPVDGWESFGNPRFVFSDSGFQSANLALQRASLEMREGVIVFVDEWGRLESQRKGIYPGALSVVNALSRGGVAVFLCRDDRIDEVFSLIEVSGVKVFILKAGDVDALISIIYRC